MKKATYTNKFLNETYVIVGVKDLAQAWRLMSFACSRKNWNFIDVMVKVSEI